MISRVFFEINFVSFVVPPPRAQRDGQCARVRDRSLIMQLAQSSHIAFITFALVRFNQIILTNLKSHFKVLKL